MEQRKQAVKKFSFCYEGKILLFTRVSARKMFMEEIPYCKICFLKILHQLWCEKHFTNPEDLIRAALEKYTGAPLYRCYNGKGLTDDPFFCLLRDCVKKKYSAIFEQEKELYAVKRQLIKEGKLAEKGLMFLSRERHYGVKKPGCYRV